MTAKNFNEGKPRYSLITKDTPNAFRERAELAEAGIAKGYERMNWAESIGTDDAPRFKEENLESILRHTLALMKGEEIDPETGKHHGACIGRRSDFAIEYYYGRQQ